MDKQILRFLDQHISADPKQVNRLIVSAFLDSRQLKPVYNTLLLKLTIQPTEADWGHFCVFRELISSYQTEFSFEDLIELFEFVVSPADKKVNGAVYTPRHIREHIVQQSVLAYKDNFRQALVCDVACGCGGFLYTYACFLHQKYNLSFKTIFEQLLYGLDITPYSIERSTIILSLLALCKGEDANYDFSNLKVGNALDFDWRATFESVGRQNGFDLILGNPPYVCAKNIGDETLVLLKRWSTAQSGNPDLYIPF